MSIVRPVVVVVLCILVGMFVAYANDAAVWIGAFVGCVLGILVTMLVEGYERIP